MGGPTPTIIFSAYHRPSKEILAVATMEISTGRVWLSAQGKGTVGDIFDYTSEKWSSDKTVSLEHNVGARRGVVPLKVSDSDMALGGFNVLVDVTHPFPSFGPALSQPSRRKLTDLIEDMNGKELSFNTNGGHYAYVASGGLALVGCITTAKGGPADMSGILHVVEAGGVAQCYKIEETDDKSRLHRLEGQDIEGADLAIAANNLGNLDQLERILFVVANYTPLRLN